MYMITVCNRMDTISSTNSIGVRYGLGDSLPDRSSLKANTMDSIDWTTQMQSIKRKTIIIVLGSASAFSIYKYFKYKKYKKIKRRILEEMESSKTERVILFIPKFLGKSLYYGFRLFFNMSKYILGGLLYPLCFEKKVNSFSYNSHHSQGATSFLYSPPPKSSYQSSIMLIPGLVRWFFGQGGKDHYRKNVYFSEEEQERIIEYENYINAKKEESGGYISLIGNTPVIKIKCLSEELGCNIYAKFEGMNPGGSSKDRVALQMILDAEESGKLSYKSTESKGKNILGEKKYTIVEGTSGSTGISLANIAKQRGYNVTIVMPNDQSQEKIKMLSNLLKVKTVVVPPSSISNPNHYCKKAQEIAESHPSTHVFMDQFETLSNFKAHYMGTGVEIIYQLEDLGISKLDAFVMSAGTGGSIAGISKRLKEYYQNRNNGINLALVKDVDVDSIATKTKPEKRDIFASLYGDDRSLNNKRKQEHSSKKVSSQKKQYQVNHHEMQNIASASKNSRLPRVVLADPPGSSLYNKVKHGICYAQEQQERNIRKHRYDTIVEGVGLDRITKNFELAEIDDAFSCTDQEILDMAHYILHKEGLCIGSSTALNLCTVVKTAYSLGWNGKQHDHLSPKEYSGNILTIICDQGSRHMSRFWNQEYCEQNYNIKWPSSPPETLTSFLNFKDVHLLQNRYRYTMRNEQLQKDQNFVRKLLLYSIASIGIGASFLRFGYHPLRLLENKNK